VSLPNTCPRCGATYDDAVAFCAIDGARLVRAGHIVDLIGTVIADRYRVVSLIGEGGMGQVYLAEHVLMKRKSAIKIMRPALVGDVEALQRFTREAENASQLSHPNIAAIFDFGETADGVVYLAMEYIDGESLGAKLEREGALHPDIAADILGQAADALQAAHDLHMLHRDIKPDNIMLGVRADGTYMVKLVDFGIARTIDGSNTRVTRTGFMVGTPEYMSPEQLAGDTLDAASDQYALALVAFYALTGQQAFPSESSRESLIARLTSRPRTLEDASTTVEWPDALQTLFDRALSPEAHDRFANISDFAHALAAAISEMTPSQTAELYRRALDVRMANLAARTPHSEGVRSGSGSMGAIRTPSAPREQPGLDAAITAAIPDDTVSEFRSTSGATRDVVATSGMSDASARALDAEDPTVESAPTARPARSRWPLVAWAIAVAGAAVWVVWRREVNRPATPTVASTDRPSPALGDSASSVRISGATALPADAAPPRPSAADSVKRAQRDSVRRAASLARKQAADSVARAANVRARYPEAAARALIARGIDGKARIARNGDVRAVFMPTPVFVWRSEQGQAWRQSHAGPQGAQHEFVDPLERWSAWSGLVASRRAVYVLEVTPEKATWPNFTPDKIHEIKRGDIESVELLRDGVPVTLENSARLVALANADAHQAAGKPLPHAIVALIAPAAFMPREDGSLPTIEVVVRDAARGSAVTRIAINASLVRRLYDDFAPWRDAIARP